MSHIILKLVFHHQMVILNAETIEWTSLSWTRSTLSHDQVIKWAKARVRVFSDSVQCLKKMSGQLEAESKWEDQVKEFQQSDSYRELFGVAGEPTEFKWNTFPGLTSLEILQRI